MDAARCLSAKFHSDTDNIARELIAAHSLKFEQEVESLSSPLNRWLDFRYRFIDPQPRQVIFSDRFPKTNLPHAAIEGLKHFTSLIHQGSDLNPYQGRGLTLRNDTSGNKRDTRTDLLWADWGITHFHLTTEPLPANQYFSRSADYLAFCLVGGDIVAFIDVLRHPDKQGFSDPSLLETVHRNWPDFMKQFELVGVLPQRDAPSNQEHIHHCRTQGLTIPQNLDGRVYIPPGMGLTSASTSAKITLAVIRIRRGVDALARAVCDPTNQFMKNMIMRGIDQPIFTLGITPKGLAVYEELSSTAFLLPKANLDEQETYMSELQGVIAPDWAVAQLMKRYPLHGSAD